MGSNIQVESMIGSLPLAVLTQRCARTTNYLSQPRHNTAAAAIMPRSLQPLSPRQANCKQRAAFDGIGHSERAAMLSDHAMRQRQADAVAL